MHRKTAPILLALALMTAALPFFTVRASAEKVTTVNVLNYGAKVNDDTDDTIAIQKALNTAASLSGTDKIKVVFPKGRYIVCAPKGANSRSLRIYSNTILELENGAELMRSAAAPDTYGFTSAEKHDIAIRGGKISGNATNTKVARGLMSLRDITGMELESVDFSSFCGTHAVLLDGIQNLRVRGCSFTGFKPFTGSADEYRAQTNATSYWASEALHIDFDFLKGRPMNNVSVSDCTFENCTSGVGTHHVVAGYIANNISITNNTFNNCYYCGCNATSFKNFEFSGNVAINTPTLLLAQNIKGSIHDNISDSSSYRPGSSTMRNIYLFGVNYLDLSSMNAINISNNKDKETGNINMMNSTDVEIYNNTLFVGSYTGTVADSSCGIKVYNNAKANIHNNIISGASSAGIYADSSNVQIDENAVYDCRSGICTSNSANCKVQDNTVISRGAGLSAVSCKNLSIKGNKLSSGEYAAISLSDCIGSNNITENTVISSSAEGIFLSGTDLDSLADNVLTGCSSDAVELINGSAVKLAEHNAFFANSGPDISPYQDSSIGSFKWNSSDKNDISGDETGSVDEISLTDVHKHSFSVGKVESPFCDHAGYKVSCCKECGLEYCSVLYPPIKHSFRTASEAPTYSAEGKTTHTCSICRTAYTERYKQAISLDDVSGMTAADNTANSVKLSWDKVSGANYYAVYVYNKSLKKWEHYKSTTASSLSVNGLNAGEAYAFTARAVRRSASGNVISPNFENCKCSTKPAKVNFTVKSDKPKTAVVRWKKVSGATSYAVFYKTKTSKWVKLATVNNKTTSFTKTGLKEGGAYYFTVRAYRTYEGKTYGGDFAAKGVKIMKTPEKKNEKN